jgi:hypothetical protein
LQEVQRNVPVTEIWKWNNVNAGTWNFISSTVIHNCFAKGHFSMEKSINKGKDKSDWRADHPSYFHSYTDYINGTLLITLKKMYSPLAWSAE